MTEKEIGFSLAHVGINCADEEEARQTAQTLCALFGLEYRPGVKSVFAGSAVECMKPPCRGRNGHIAIATGDLEGASALLRRNLLIYGVGGIIAPFVGIKLIDLVVSMFM